MKTTFLQYHHRKEGQKQGIRAIKCLENACTAKKLVKLKPVIQDLYWFPTEFQLLHMGFWPAHQNFNQWQAFCFLFNIILNTKSKNYLLSSRGSALISAVHCYFLSNSSTGHWSSTGVVLLDQPGQRITTKATPQPPGRGGEIPVTHPWELMDSTGS